MTKRMRLASVLVASVIVFSSFFGCKGEENTSSVFPTESMPSSSVSEPIGSLPESSAPESSSSEASTSVTSEELPTLGEELTTIVTSDKEFNKVFEKNPIDVAYKKEMGDATSSTEILEVAQKYTKIWQDEIAAGYKKLMDSKAPSDKKTSYKEKQANWEKDTPAALEKISVEAQALGGSMAQVEIAGKTMEHYRARAAAVYKNLYGFDKKFTYAFKVK